MVLTNTDCCFDPRVLQTPHTVHLSAFIRLLLLLCFLSVDLPVVYSQIFPNSLSPPSELLPHSTLWECGRRRSVGDVTPGMQQIQTQQKGGGASLQTSGFMKLRTGRKTEMKLMWRLCQEPDWCRAEEYQYHLAAVC